MTERQRSVNLSPLQQGDLIRITEDMGTYKSYTDLLIDEPGENPICHVCFSKSRDRGMAYMLPGMYRLVGTESNHLVEDLRFESPLHKGVLEEGEWLVLNYLNDGELWRLGKKCESFEIYPNNPASQ